MSYYTRLCRTADVPQPTFSTPQPAKLPQPAHLCHAQRIQHLVTQAARGGVGPLRHIVHGGPLPCHNQVGARSVDRAIGYGPQARQHPARHDGQKLGHGAKGPCMLRACCTCKHLHSCHLATWEKSLTFPPRATVSRHRAAFAHAGRLFVSCWPNRASCQGPPEYARLAAAVGARHQQ